MSIPVQLALSVGLAVRNKELIRDIPGDGKHFDKNIIKLLPPTDRKVCYRALSAIERAQLSSFEPKEAATKHDLKTRLSEVTKAVGRPIQVKEGKTPKWYKRPFLWVARCVHSFVLWFKNTFMGRVSSQKLYNKVETYLNDYNRAQKRVALLTKAEGGLIVKAEQELERSVANQKAFLKSFNTLVEVHETLRLIDVTMAKSEKSKIKGMENFRQEIQDAWIVDGLNAKVIPYTQTKGVISKLISEASPEVQNYLKDLYIAAQGPEENTKNAIQQLQQAGLHVTEEMQEQFKVGNNHRAHVEKAKKHLTDLKSELELLTKKYPN